MCPAGCTDAKLGSLTRQMQEAGIGPVNITRNAYSLSVDRLHGIISAFVTPSSPSKTCWTCFQSPLEDEVMICLEESLELLKGSWLNSVWEQRMKDREAEQARLSASRDSWRAHNTP